MKHGANMFSPAQIEATLAELKGLAAEPPQTVAWSAPGGEVLEADFTAVDSLGCAFRELRLEVPALAAAAFDIVIGWADDFCRRVNYLLEPLARVEQDSGAQVVLARSSPPDRQPARTAFYEIRLHAPNRFSLTRRFTTPDEPTPQPLDMFVTHELFQKLVRDLVSSIPGPAAGAK